jgi:CubicO group peptidase (beta-lactamase class C family)
MAMSTGSVEVTADQLRERLAEGAERLAVPGAAVGVYQAGREQHAFHGVTSVENPLQVDERTLFQIGSTGKTYTATALLRLVEQGSVELDAPVRRYVPELRLKDEEVARTVTVLQLLNHTAGWQGDMMDDTGDGDDALANYVDRMANLEQELPLGAAVAYNNASLSLAGRVIEKVTGKAYERAMKELLFEPLGLEHSFFFPNEIMSRRFAVGHKQGADGTIKVARPWALPRGGNPAGGISADVADQIAWARFHLGDGRAADGTRVLASELLDRMKQPTVTMPGSALGDAVGISWMLRDAAGVRLVSHGGSTNGQYSEFVMVPERDFAIAIMANCGPNGPQLNKELLRWALEAYLGVVDRDPEPVALSAAELAPYAGTYETIAVIGRISVDGGGLLLEVEIKPEALAQLTEAGEEPPEDRPFPLGLLPGPRRPLRRHRRPGQGHEGLLRPRPVRDGRERPRRGPPRDPHRRAGSRRR